MTATMYKEILEAPLEDVLCLATLIATSMLPPTATLKDSDEYFARREYRCDNCSIERVCLAIIMNQ